MLSAISPARAEMEFAIRTPRSAKPDSSTKEPTIVLYGRGLRPGQTVHRYGQDYRVLHASHGYATVERIER